MVGLRRLELLTPRLSSVCSNQLSYRPTTIPSTKPSKKIYFSNGPLIRVHSLKTKQLVKGLGLTIEWRLSCENLCILRKEVIQPQVPLRLPCYDFTPIISRTLGACFLSVSTATSGTTNFHGVTGGVYKARERIHRGMLIRDY